MKYVIIAGLTLCAGASVALADPLRLSSAEIDQITASGLPSALLAGESEVGVVIRVTRDGQTLVDRQVAHSTAIPPVPASLERSSTHVANSLADVGPVELATPTIAGPSRAGFANPAAEVARAADLARPTVVRNAVEAARPVDLARPATTFQATDLARSIEAKLGQVRASAPLAAGSGFTVQRTHVVAHSAGSMASATARNVNITR